MLVGLRAVVITLVVVGSVGCSQDVSRSENEETSISEIKGACADIHNSQVCTWAKMQGETVLEVGATVPIASIENAPADTAMVWPPVPVATLDIPEAARQKSGMGNLTVFWEPHGHPTPTFLTPHFDFHFNGISAAEHTECTGRIALDWAWPAVCPVFSAAPLDHAAALDRTSVSERVGSCTVYLCLTLSVFRVFRGVCPVVSATV